MDVLLGPTGARDHILRWNLSNHSHCSQLYKALEAGYQTGLEELQSSGQTSEECKIVFAQQMLQFDPPIEKLRSTYYDKLKRFVGIPVAFTGFGNTKVYQKMGVRNKALLAGLYRATATIFENLESVLEDYQSHVALAQLDLEIFIEENLTDADDFEFNLNLVSSKLRDIERLEDKRKVHCFTVSLVDLKIFLRNFTDRVRDVVLLALRRKILEQFKSVDTFLIDAHETLYRRPSTVRELAEAKQALKELGSQKDSFRKSSNMCGQLSNILFTCG